MTPKSEIKQIKSAAVHEFSMCITFEMTIIYVIGPTIFLCELHTTYSYIDNKIKHIIRIVLRGQRGPFLLVLTVIIKQKL